MSACEFSVQFSGEAQAIYEKTKSAVEAQGGQFEGDATGGRFHVSLMSNTISGTYRVNNNQLHFIIDTKPMFLPCNAIQGYLASKLS